LSSVQRSAVIFASSRVMAVGAVSYEGSESEIDSIRAPVTHTGDEETPTCTVPSFTSSSVAFPIASVTVGAGPAPALNFSVASHVPVTRQRA